jgi:1,4-dihydroxy-2-naphthoyl-CoA hydrolase
VKLHDTDAAGVLFFGNYFRLIHEAYEHYMASIGFDFYHIIHEADFLLLIVHAEADFKQALHVGDKVRIILRTDRIGRTSFTLGYEVRSEKGDLVATAETAHANILKETNRPTGLPSGLKAELEKLT